MKKIAAIILVLVLVISCFAGCGAKKRSLETIKKSRELVIYTEAGFAPYEFVKDNEVVGVDIEIMKAVAEKIGVKLTVKDVEFKNIVAGVKAGKVDAGAAGITINELRKKEIDFSVPYAKTEQYVIVPADQAIPTLEDLNGKKIGVQESTTTDSMIQNLINEGTIKDVEVTTYVSPAIAAASMNKLFCIVTDRLTAENVVAANNGTLKTAKFLKADGTDVAEIEEYGIAVAKGNDELLKVIDEVITELLANGQIDKWTNEFTEMAKIADK